MALATYFDKAALAVAGVLADFEFQAFSDELSAAKVGIALDDAAAETFEGQVACELAANLLARLYPRVGLAPTGTRASALAEKLAEQMRSINSRIEIDAKAEGTVLVFGSTPLACARPIYVGSHGWLARLSADAPVVSGGSANPFGAAAAACFGVANVFRALFGSRLPPGGGDLDQALSFSTFSPGDASAIGPDLVEPTIGNSALIGVGAIGSGLVWTLARLRELRGTLHLVDNETAEPTNSQRYVMLTEDSHRKPKVAVAAKRLQIPMLTVSPHKQTYAAFFRKHGNDGLDRLVVALDTAQARVEVQASLPKRILNSWTQTENLGVSRHDFLGDGACLACLYIPHVAPRAEDVSIAEALGIPAQFIEVRRYLQRGSPVASEFLDQVATGLGVPRGELKEFEGKPIRTLYSGFVCSGKVLKFAAGSRGQGAQVPLAFQSALAGVLLAAELVIDAGRLRSVPSPEVTRIDLLKPLSSFLSMRERKRRDGRCICQDEDFQAAYARKWPTTVG